MSKLSGIVETGVAIAGLGIAVITGISAVKNAIDGNTLYAVCDAGMAFAMAVASVIAGKEGIEDIKESV